MLTSTPITLELEPDPNGPMTLAQDIRMINRAIPIMERVAHGNGFNPPERIEQARQTQGDQHARMALLLEAHPDLARMNAEHEQLLKSCYAAEKSGQEVTDLQGRCAALATQICELERSVDLG